MEKLCVEGSEGVDIELIPVSDELKLDVNSEVSLDDDDRSRYSLTCRTPRRNFLNPFLESCFSSSSMIQSDAAFDRADDELEVVVDVSDSDMLLESVDDEW